MGNRQYEGQRFRVLEFFNEWNLKSIEQDHQQTANVSTDKWIFKRLINQDQNEQVCDCLSLLFLIPANAAKQRFEQSVPIKIIYARSWQLKCPWIRHRWGRNKKILQSMEATWSVCRFKLFSRYFRLVKSPTAKLVQSVSKFCLRNAACQA